MATIRYGDFEWDDEKALRNARKHGVTFEEATTAFDDPRAIDAPDLDAAERFVLIGFSVRDRILFVVHAVREERIRIISARRASRAQRKKYEEG